MSNQILKEKDPLYEIFNSIEEALDKALLEVEEDKYLIVFARDKFREVKFYLEKYN